MAFRVGPGAGFCIKGKVMHYGYFLYFPNGKGYIGVSENVQRRLADHRESARKGSLYAVHSAIRKYGFENIRAYTVFECDTVEKAFVQERLLIEQFQTPEFRKARLERMRERRVNGK